MISFSTFLSCLIGIILLAFVKGWWSNGYFKRNGVKSPMAYIPYIGHMCEAMWQGKHVKDFITKTYNLYSSERYFGLIQFGKPLVVLRDLQLIKQLTIKDFDHFLDHFAFLDNELVFGNSLFALRGQKWRDMRATLSPAFTSSKMRGMFEFIVECGEQMADYYEQQMRIPENKVRGLIEVEMKDVFTRYTNDVIATTAFGLKVNSFLEKENQFYLKGKELTDFSVMKTLKVLCLIMLPKVGKLRDIQFYSKTLRNFYRNLVWDTIKYREKHNVIRNDMIQLLMEARKGTLKHDSHDKDGKDAGFATVEESTVGKTIVQRVWSDDEIVAQVLLFLMAGFDTSATLLSFLTHELAIHPEIQKRLQEEIDEVAVKLDNGKLTYDSLQKMKYLDMVVCETLRKWPPNIAVDRVCIKPYTLPPPNENGKEFQLRVNDAIWIPIYGLHHDPKYFKDPEVFNPERFSDENKHEINPLAYLPFGIGPRNCIGSRFALMESKAVICNILRKFDIIPTAKTQNPLKLKLGTFLMTPERGFWVGLRPRVITK